MASVSFRWLTMSVLGALLAAAPAAAANAKPKVAVLDIAGTDAVGRDLPLAIGAMVGQELGDLGLFDVITQSEVRQLIGFDRMKVALSCELDSSCLAEIGAALGARWLVAGSVAAVGEELVLSLSLIDIEEASTTAREVVRAERGAVLAGVAAQVRALVRPLTGHQTGLLKLEGVADGALVEIDGRLVGSTPLAPLALAPGRHRVAIQRAGSFEYQTDVEVRAGGRHLLKVELREATVADDPRLLIVSGGLTLGGGALMALAGYGASALFAFSYARIPFYESRSPWLLVPGVGAAVFAALYTATDDPTGANDRGTGLVLSLSALGLQLGGAALATAGAAVLTWGLLE